MSVTTSNIYHNGEVRALIAKWRAQAKFLMKMSVSKSNHLDVMAARYEAQILRKCAIELRKLMNWI